MIINPTRIGALVLVAGVMFGACSTPTGASTPPSAAPASTEPSMAPASTEPSMAAVSGTISVSGSSTVEPISTGVAEAFKAANPDFNYTIEGPGTGDGFKRFCKGETDISDASRKIKPEGEADVCAAAGIEYIEIPIAYDGITVMTSPSNTQECLSYPDLYALIGPESTGFAKWSDAQALATELKSATTYPADLSLDITGPGEESGTYDSFVELALDKLADPRGKIDPATKHTTTRPDYIASYNDNQIIEGIAASDGSLGWVGFAFAQENADKVKEMAISKDPVGDCIKPSAETIADGTYPLSRTLYIYVNKAKAASNAAIGAFVDYYLAEGTISSVLQTVPYVNLPADMLVTSRGPWEASK